MLLKCNVMMLRKSNELQNCNTLVCGISLKIKVEEIGKTAEFQWIQRFLNFL